MVVASDVLVQVQHVDEIGLHSLGHVDSPSMGCCATPLWRFMHRNENRFSFCTIEHSSFNGHMEVRAIGHSTHPLQFVAPLPDATRSDRRATRGGP